MTNLLQRPASITKHDLDYLQTNLRVVAAKKNISAPNLDPGAAVDEMSWPELHDYRKGLMTFVRDLIDAQKKVPAEELAKRSPTTEELMAIDYALWIRDICTDEMEHRSECGNLGTRTKGRTVGGAVSEVWRSSEGNPIPVLAPEHRVANCIVGGGAEEDRHLSLAQIMRAMVLGPKNDAERRALSEGTDSTGGYTVNAALSAQLIDRMRAKTRIVQAGAVTVPLETLTTKMARIASDPTVGWHTENTQESDSNMTFEQVTFTARTMMAIVRASREMLEDSINAEEALMQAFAGAMAGELDRVALYGTGSAPQPTGLIYVSGIGIVELNGVISSWSHLLDGVQKLLEANQSMPTAAIMHPRILIDFNKLLDANSQYREKPDLIRTLPLLETTQVSLDEGGSPAQTSIFLGDWSKMMIGVRTQLRIEVLRERYADFLQYGFVAWLRADIQVRQPGAFCRIKTINT